LIEYTYPEYFAVTASRIQIICIVEVFLDRPD